jgi:hypothetical protein
MRDVAHGHFDAFQAHRNSITVFWMFRAAETRPRLPPLARPAHASPMFVVSEEAATAIRTAFDRGGELSAAVELRRLFPSVTDTAQARTAGRWRQTVVSSARRHPIFCHRP